MQYAEMPTHTRMHVKGVVDFEYTKDLFVRLLREIPWSTCKWNSALDKLKLNTPPSYHYGVYERLISKKESLEDLASLVESTFETDVQHIQCWMLRHGEDGLNRISLDTSHDIVYLTLGTSRKLIFDSPYTTDDDYNITRVLGRTKEEFNMRNGDALFVPCYENVESSRYTVKKNDGINSVSLHFCLEIKKPYATHHQSTANIHFLGFGNISVGYNRDSYPNGLPDNTVLAMAPQIQGETPDRGLQPTEEQLSNLIDLIATTFNR